MLLVGPWRSFWVWCLLALALIGTGTVAQVAAAQDCPCVLTGRTVAEIGDGQVSLTYPIAVATVGSRYFVVPVVEPSAILVFGEDGEGLGRVGRAGRGPGEFRSIAAIAPGQGDSLWVLDVGNMRLSVIDRNLRIARSERLPFIAGRMGILADAGVVLMRPIPKGGAATRIHVFDQGLSEVSSFHVSEPYGEESLPGSLGREMHVRATGKVAVAHRREWVVEIWDSSGVLEGRLELPGAWPDVDAGDKAREGAPAPTEEVRAVGLDESHRIWLYIRVPDPRWRDALGEVRGIFGVQRGTPLGALSGRWDTVVQVVDPDSGNMLAEQRFEWDVAQALGANRVAVYTEDGIGRATIRVHELQLRAGPGR